MPRLRVTGPVGAASNLRSGRGRNLLTLLVWVLTWIMVLLGLGLPARGAEVPDENRVRGQRATPATTGPIITDTAIPQSLGTATLFVPSFLAFTGGNFSPSWRRVSASGDFRSLSSPVQLFVGVAPRTSVYVVVPYQHNWALNVNQPASAGQRSADFGGLGDVNLTGKYLLMKEQAMIPAVAGIFSVSFPSGHHRHLNPGNLGTDQLGLGAYSFTPGLNFFKFIPPVLLYGNLWYTMSTGATVAGARKYYPDRVILDLALEYPLRKPFVFLCEFVSFYDGGRLVGHRANQSPQALMSLLPALEILVSDDWSFAAGVLVDLFGKNTGFTYTPNFSIFYTF